MGLLGQSKGQDFCLKKESHTSDGSKAKNLELVEETYDASASKWMCMLLDE